jgi:adenine phosphoribosyltransferase
MDLEQLIRDIPDFPKEGIIFKDITPLIGSSEGLRETIELFRKRYEGKGIEQVVGVESRGFIFGAALACALGAGFVPVRKPGKLPAETLREEYELEYGTDAVEIHRDAIAPGQKVLVIDDLLATGGTLAATCRLVKALGGEIVEVATLIELAFLDGRAKLGDLPYYTVMRFG